MRIAWALRQLSSLSAGIGTVDVQGQGGRIEAWAPMPEKPNPFLPPHKPLTKLSDVLAKHKGQQDWIRSHRQRQPLSWLVHLHGARRENSAPIPSGQPRVLDHSGRANPVHDRRRRAVRRVEGISRAGTEAPRLQHGNGRQHAVAAIRGVDGELADDVSGR